MKTLFGIILSTLVVVGCGGHLAETSHKALPQLANHSSGGETGTDGSGITNPVPPTNPSIIPNPSCSSYFLSGIAISAIRGPIMPICKIDTLCEVPYGNVSFSISQHIGGPKGPEKTVAVVTTGQDGTATIGLPAGSYTISTNTISGFFGPPPSQNVVVSQNIFSRVSFSFDTGIR